MKTIDDLIQRSIIEAFDDAKRKRMQDAHLNEKEKQDDLSSKLDSQDDSGDDEHHSDHDDRDDEKRVDAKNDVKTMDKKLETVPEVEDVVEALNSIRSGKSLKDSAIESRFEKYFTDLKDAEKVALYAFLKGIGQIVTGGLDPHQAVEPRKPPADITMHKGKHLQQRNLHPSVIKKPNVPEKKHRSEREEDDSAPLPVKTVKR